MGFLFSGPFQTVSEGEFSGDLNMLNSTIQAAQDTANSAVSAAGTAQNTANTALAGMVRLYHETFTEGTTSPLPIISDPVAGAYVPMVKIRINSAAAQPGASITVGQTGTGGTVDRYLKAVDTDLTKVGQSVGFPGTCVGNLAGTSINLYINPNGQTFSGEVFVMLAPITPAES